MVNMSQSLGVGCTFCHNTRTFDDWSASPVARVTAYHGIRMTRDLNLSYVEPLGADLPKERMGPAGDAPKVNCNTCHDGAFRPLLGVSMLKDYQELAALPPPPPPPPPADAVPAEGDAGTPAP
jgi:photosynthetic reaction center cytochrome c subunit